MGLYRHKVDHIGLVQVLSGSEFKLAGCAFYIHFLSDAP